MRRRRHHDRFDWWPFQGPDIWVLLAVGAGLAPIIESLANR
jgi:hypothetical protein